MRRVILNNVELGRFGEEKAVNYLEKQNYKIIARNVSCNQGEIDIIAKDKNEIVFFEVKTRHSLDYGRPVEAVNNFKQKHIWDAAKYYLYKNNLINAFVRFDAIEVYLKNNNIFINQIKNIFE